MSRIRQFENAAEIASQSGVAAWGLAAFAKLALMNGPLQMSIRKKSAANGKAYALKSIGKPK